ncbi:MAG: DNA polymerase II large subunit [Candidatus Micrarchaeales archaeon]
MEIDEYFDLLTMKFEEANLVATAAKAKGYDPENFVEIKAAPDLAARVEGIMGIEGLAEVIKKKSEGRTRQELAFEIVKEVCTDKRFEMEVQKRLTLAVRVGLCILTEGVLVAPTEGLQGMELHRNGDGTDYIAVLYAGPIRGAGGTSAALSVAFADQARKILGIGAYKATPTEVERWIEEMLIYDARCARLQYKPSEEDMRILIENCPVCVDGVPTEEIEVGIRRNLKRLDANGKEQPITNKVRGGIGLVLCEGIAQKAKSVLKFTKGAGLDWGWLNNIIKVDKGAQSGAKDEKKEAVFLQELVAGRPVLAYPNYPGSFRLRYGRTRLSGIAAKGFSPATMYLLEEFIATGTQVKVEKPGKGCIATPVDSIEGPFVKLSSGEAMRINDIEQAKAVGRNVIKIISVGDVLITYGDFKKTNTPLPPTSYVEEYWIEQLYAAGFKGEPKKTIPSFKESYELSKAYGIPMHPRWIYDYNEITSNDILEIAKAILKGDLAKKDAGIFEISELVIPITTNSIRDAIERLCIPHFDDGSSILVRNDDAQSILTSLGFVKNEKVVMHADSIKAFDTAKEPLDLINSIAPFKIMKRATRIGARIGRPEKARERLMTPAPSILFPIGEYGSKDRNLYKAYMEDKRRFGDSVTEVEIARYRCPTGKELVTSPHCFIHNSRAVLERICEKCGRITSKSVCAVCNSKTIGYSNTKINLSTLLDDAMKNIGVQSLPKVMKGVKGLVSRDKIAEPLEKGILRSNHGIYIFKDGTTRFDATDTPITHFYPKEIGVSVEKLREIGYTYDYLGNPLENSEQLVEMRHQDVILNTRGAEYMLKVAKFMDDLLVKFYKMEPFYKINSINDLVGHFVITLSPHTSCGVLGRIIGFTNAHVGLAHPYTISARRRNCDGDEDTTMLLLDGLINFSKRYLPVTIGGTMDAPLILTLHVLADEVDDEVHAMESVTKYGLDFYNKTYSYPSPSEISLELVGNRLKSKAIYKNINFTHETSATALIDAPAKSVYTKLKTMQEKIDLQFKLMDKLYTIDKQDTARRLINSHFIPDLMGNLHSFSKQTFRCVACNSKYRRIPLVGKCTKCKGKIVLTISKGGIEKYLNVATALSERYSLEPYTRQRIMLLRDEIETVFGGVGGGERAAGQFDLTNFM